MTNSHELYSDIELSSEVMTASNHRLVQMLLDKCVEQIQVAKSAITQNEMNLKRSSISRAKNIIDYLRLCLNFEDGNSKNLSELLDSLYQFLEKSLLLATLKNEHEHLDHAEAVLANIKSGWDGIKNK